MSESQKSGEPQAFTCAMMGTVALASYLWLSMDLLIPAYRDSLIQGSQGGGVRLGLLAVQDAVLSQLSLVLPHDPSRLQDWTVLLAILWTGIVTTAITSFGENVAMKSLSSAETTVIFSTEPLWGTGESRSKSNLKRSISL